MNDGKTILLAVWACGAVLIIIIHAGPGKTAAMNSPSSRRFPEWARSRNPDLSNRQVFRWTRRRRSYRRIIRKRLRKSLSARNFSSTVDCRPMATVACASCHNPERAFTDGKPNFYSFTGRLGQRNAPTILNALYNKTQFWDGRAQTLEDQAALPIVNSIEMGQPNLKAAVARITAVGD